MGTKPALFFDEAHIKQRAYSKKYYRDNRNKVRQQAKRNSLLHPGRDKKYDENWRLKNPKGAVQAIQEWQKNNRQAYRAKLIACRLIPVAKQCEICGATGRIERHHRDYGKPLEVLMLCKACHEAYHEMETPICSKQKEIRFYRGGEPVEILDHSDDSHRGQKWPCRVLSTGEIKNIVVGSLHYLPIARKRHSPTVSKCQYYVGALKCSIKPKCPFAFNASLTRCPDAKPNKGTQTT